MTPLHELLARIRWDREFGRGRFEIGYWDRVDGRIVRIPLPEATMDAASPAVFQIVDDTGATRTIPFHRVKAVWRDGLLIWHREH